MGNKKLRVIGLMSGTSLDGVDVVLVDFNSDGGFELVACETFEYSKYWLGVLKDVFTLPKGDVLLKEFDVLLGRYFGELVLRFMNSNNVKDVALIASHGHTVHHQPDRGYTLQIGCGEEIFKTTGVKTVYDFRSQDVLFGGQGAPLVPVGDELLFSDYDYCLNLGGFSNVSYRDKGIRKAFDICPVNTVLNFYAQKLGFLYDAGGELSREGVVNECLLTELNSLKYYNQAIPKSLGVEFLKSEVYPLLLKYNLTDKCILRTFVEHVAIQISNNIKRGEVLVTGGGAFNTFLMSRIVYYAKEAEFVVPSADFVNFKEALIFSLLGKLRLEGVVNCYASVTGASKDHSSGVVVG